jgi:hypothetical protein
MVYFSTVRRASKIWHELRVPAQPRRMTTISAVTFSTTKITALASETKDSLFLTDKRADIRPAPVSPIPFRLHPPYHGIHNESAVRPLSTEGDVWSFGLVSSITMFVHPEYLEQKILDIRDTDYDYTTEISD